MKFNTSWNTTSAKVKDHCGWSRGKKPKIILDCFIQPIKLGNMIRQDIFNNFIAV